MCVLIRIASLRRFYWEHTTYRHVKENQRDPYYASWPGAIINPKWLKLPLSRTKFHGPKGVRAIEVRLFFLLTSLKPASHLLYRISFCQRNSMISSFCCSLNVVTTFFFLAFELVVLSTSFWAGSNWGGSSTGVAKSYPFPFCLWSPLVASLKKFQNY